MNPQNWPGWLKAALRPVKKILFTLAPNAITPFIPCRNCVHRFPALSDRVNQCRTPDFPVDVVYTWVDGSDQNHLAKRQSYASTQDIIHPESLSPARYRDNDELRYSIRSLERYAPWVNHIYVVTDEQRPAWLDPLHERVTVVDHREIIPERYLPTFNSHVIEAYLHRIPSLSEHYIYCNDDFLLTNACGKGDFFSGNGLPYIFLDWRTARMEGYQRNATPHAASYTNTVSYLEDKLGIPVQPIINAHGPYAMTRKCAEAVWDCFGEWLERMSAHRFRSMDETAFYCHAAPMWANHHRMAVPCDVAYYYINTRQHDRQRYYREIIGQNSHVPFFCCINDVAGEETDETWRHDLHRFLSAFLPEPSAFEIDGSGSGGRP